MRVSVEGKVSVTVTSPEMDPLPTFWTEVEYINPDWPRVRLPESVRLATKVAEVPEIPVPLSATVRGTTSKPFTTVSCPPSCPINVGVYVTVIVQVPPAAIVFPLQVSVSPKSPEIVTFARFMLVEPEFVTITACEALATPTAVLGKLKLAGEAVVVKVETDTGMPAEAALAKLTDTDAFPVPTELTMPWVLTEATAALEELKDNCEDPLTSSTVPSEKVPVIRRGACSPCASNVIVDGWTVIATGLSDLST